MLNVQTMVARASRLWQRSSRLQVLTLVLNDVVIVFVSVVAAGILAVGYLFNAVM
jgi:hypothetical protein